MKYALIGCGTVAKNHITAAQKNGLEITAVCDLIPENIDKLFANAGYAGSPDRYTDYKKMMSEHPEITLAAIATDSGSHAEIALYLIEHGVNVIIEKPMAMSISDADRIIELSAQKGVVVTVCQQNRFNLPVQKLRAALESGRLGKISHAAVNVRWCREKSYYDRGDWRGKWATDGGCLMNQCIHGIDILRWMLGDEVVEVYGVTDRKFHSYIECEDVGTAILKFKNGAIGLIEGTVNTCGSDLEETLCLFGENGTVRLGGISLNKVDVWQFADSRPEDREISQITENVENVYGNGHVNLYKDMIYCVQNGKKPYVDALAGRNALETVLAIYLSSATGKPVKLPLKNCSSTDFSGFFCK